jgi:Mn-dependent DtxR family transcriptional regulator
MKIQESAEMYLETILVLSQRNSNVRSIDIACELDYKKPSVSVAMKNLRENGYISVDQDGYITLTKEGKVIAETMYERHTIISDWLILLGVNEADAVKDACRMEHVISKASFEAIKKHLESIRKENKS